MTSLTFICITKMASYQLDVFMWFNRLVTLHMHTNLGSIGPVVSEMQNKGNVCGAYISGGFRGGHSRPVPPLLKQFSINAPPPFLYMCPPLLKKKKKKKKKVSDSARLYPGCYFPPPPPSIKLRMHKFGWRNCDPPPINVMMHKFLSHSCSSWDTKVPPPPPHIDRCSCNFAILCFIFDSHYR